MKRFLAEMPSCTYAVKAKRLLGRRGIPCDIRRRSSGCGCDLVLYSESALRLLDRAAIPYSLSPGGGEP